jgi:hypothetical protein
MMHRPLITFTTDFGTRDSYVGVMKGVVLSICPQASIVDLTHEITPQHVVETAFVLAGAIPYFPVGTIHVVVVDPGVGSTRRAVVLSTPRACFVGPDNGVFGLVWQDARTRWELAQVHAIELRNTRYWLPKVSNTFHGRDIFAPVAAHLAQGVPLHELGPPLDMLVTLPIPEPERTSEISLSGQIIYLDHFGNAITNISRSHLEHIALDHTLWSRLVVKIGTSAPYACSPSPTDTVSVALHTTYADVDEGEPLALIGSSQWLELAVRNGSAALAMGITPGVAVHVALPAEQTG